MLESLWTYKVHHAVHAFALDGNECFFTARGTRLIALDVETGNEMWSVRVDNPWGWLAVTPEMVYYLNQHTHLVAVERTRGTHRWSRELRGINGWLHAYGNRVIVGGWRSYTDVLALDAADGADVWCRPARHESLHSTRIHAASETLPQEEAPTTRPLRLTRRTRGCRQIPAPDFRGFRQPLTTGTF